MAEEPASSIRMKKRRAGAADVEIGRKIRALRLQRGLSQTDLADGIDLTFQQVQKYEKGTNRVSAGRLQQIAAKLNTPITFFYDSMKPGFLTEAAKMSPGILIVGSLPESDAEAGGERGRAALRRLEQVFGRVQSPWLPPLSAARC